MTTITVGQPIDPRRTPRPEGVHYQLERGGHVLYAFYANPSRSEVAAYQHGKCELAVYVEQPAVFVLAQFGTQPWIDAPFSWHLVPNEHKPTFTAEPDAPQTDARELVTVVLAEARDTTVRALRVLTMPRAVGDAIRAAMRVQAVTPWDVQAYDAVNESIAARLSTEQMLERAVARGVAGK